MKTWQIALIVSGVFLGLATVAEVKGSTEKNQAVTTITRESYGGKTREETFLANVSGNEEEITIKVAPRKYTSEMIDALFEEALRELPGVILADNKDWNHVESRLNLTPKLEGYPFLVSYSLSRYDVMDLTGRIYEDYLKEEDPSGDGIAVMVNVVLKYEEKQREMQLQAILVPMEKEGEIAEMIRGELALIDEMTGEDDSFTLPEEIGGMRVTYRKPGQSRLPIILILCVFGVGGAFLADRDKVRTERKKRNEQMLLDYPDIVSQFTMLLGAGMTAKSVWGKIAGDYEKQKARTGRARAAYDEILVTYGEMKSGIPEAECYERFARRSELLPYMKLGALLAQNVKKGAKGMAEVLQTEAIQAMEDRKSQAKKLGEEAGTKLLVPMMIMLVIVMAIVMVPAFFSIQV